MSEEEICHCSIRCNNGANQCECCGGKIPKEDCNDADCQHDASKRMKQYD